MQIKYKHIVALVALGGNAHQQKEENTDARREGKRGECVLDTDITIALQK